MLVNRFIPKTALNTQKTWINKINISLNEVNFIVMVLLK